MRRNKVALLMLHAARALRCAPLRTRRTLALRSTQPRIYDAPTLYDAAFGFRDFEDEVDFLCAAHERHGRTGGALAGGRGPGRDLRLQGLDPGLDEGLDDGRRL